MWQSQVQPLNAGRVQKISLWDGGKPIPYARVIHLWQQDESFQEFFTSLLADAPFSAFFWETPAVAQATVDQPFECVLMDSPPLARVQSDPSAFADYFAAADPEEMVISFPNLGHDALLVVPCPQATTSAYPHIAAFAREAPKRQQQALWQRVGLALERRLNQQPIWLSTSGLGVYWLHIRLDSFPKYYSFHPYKLFVPQ